MRITSTARKFDTSMDLQQRGFTIAASAKMFHILSDSLYKHKELAIVRELTANAYDAHIKAKTTDTPFEVHLPTPLEPFFRIKDYGTGLSEQAIYDLYTRYGGSDKTMSDELVGGFGLGSKSPFAYTDQFSVETRYKGKLIKFHAYMDDQGMPSIAKITELPTTEANGLTVEVPVASQAYQPFADAAARVLPYVPIAFNVNILPDELATVTTPPEYMATLPGSGNTIIKIKKSETHGCNVVMGIVAYPVEDSIFPYDAPEFHILRNFAFDIYAPIGAFDIAASRESLSYNQQTKDLLTKCIADAVVPFCQKIKDEIDAAPNLLEAYERYQNTSGGVRHVLARYIDKYDLGPSHPVSKLREWFLKKATWQGKEFKMFVPPGIIWRRIQSSGWRNKRPLSETYWDLSSATAPQEIDLYIVKGSRVPALYWKEKHNVPFLAFFEKDPSAILPAWLFTGDKAAVIKMFADIGMDVSSTLRDLPDVQRAAGGKRAAYGAHQYLTWLPGVSHESSRSKAADLAKYANRLVIHPDIGDKHYFDAAMGALSHAQLLDLDMGTLAHVVIPPSHKRVKETLENDGATASLLDFLKNGPGSIDREALKQHLAIQRVEDSWRSPWPFLRRFSYEVQQQFLGELEKAGLDDLWMYFVRDLWFQSMESTRVVSTSVTDQLAALQLIPEEELAREAELLEASWACHAQQTEQVWAKYALADKFDAMMNNYYTRHQWSPLLDLMIHYLKT